MRVIPVIDLMQGQVVRGVGGRRHEYRPIVSQLVDSAEPPAIARALIDAFGATEIYVADLDAITTHRPDVDRWPQIAGQGCSLLLDAGVRSAAEAFARWECLAGSAAKGQTHRLVLGLESFASLAELPALAAAVPHDRLVFSLDLKAGVPLVADKCCRSLDPLAIARQVYTAGLRTMIVLDLADVGSGQGTSTLPLVRNLRIELPELEIIAGGGVRGPADLQTMRAAGCAGALVASALHDGRLNGSGFNDRRRNVAGPG
jgi:phosphoribosylformimino-5-aminoimidazole carboxamide ribotide isomerase